MKKFVISGGPASGKTTLINELEQRKYNVIEETAFKLMQQRPRITNWKKFNYDVFEHQIQVESEISKDADVIFLDRCLVDSLAYMRFYQIDPPEDCKQKIREAKYQKVFFLDVLPDKYYFATLNGQPRRLDIWAARELHNMTKALYLEFKIPLVSVPFLNVKSRADFVINNL